MKTQACCSSHARLHGQRGMVTLLTAVVILLMATVLVIAVSKTSLMELRISGNEVRARQALAASEAGLSFALAYVAQTTQGGATVPSGADKNSDSVADTIALTTLTAPSNAYSVKFCDPIQALTAISCPDAPAAVTCTAAPTKYLRTPRVVACGWSDDGQARSLVSLGVGVVPAIKGGITNPVTAKGAMNVSGSATVTNYYNNLTVWTGGTLTDIGNSGKTFVRNPTVPPPLSSTPPPAPPTTCSAGANYVCATDKNTTGPDVIDSDPTLSNLTTAQMFKNYFGTDTVATYQATVASRAAVAPGNVGTLSGVLGEAFVVSSDVNTPGSGTVTDNMNFTIGSRDQPVVMIVDGNWTGAGNTTIYGIVYVRGNIDLSGSKTIYGGVIVEGTVSGTGSLDVIYDPAVADNAANRVGKAGNVPGSWRDWK